MPFLSSASTFLDTFVHANLMLTVICYFFSSQKKQYFNCDVFVNKNASKITFMVIHSYV